MEVLRENEKEKIEIDIIDSIVKMLLTKHKINFVDKRSWGGASTCNKVAWYAK